MLSLFSPLLTFSAFSLPLSALCVSGFGRFGYSVPATRYSVLFLIDRRLRALFQRLPVPDRAFTRVIRQLEILRQFERVRRTSVFAQSAEHAPAQVVRERGEFFAARLLVALARHDD